MPKNFAAYLGPLPGFIRLAFSWWAIRVIISQVTRNFFPPPPTVPLCKISPADIDPAGPGCEKYCSLPVYKGNFPVHATVKGESWWFCCPKGYHPAGVKDPITHEITSMTCERD